MKKVFLGFGGLALALNAGATEYWVASDGTGDGRSSGTSSSNLVNVVNNMATAAGDVVHVGPGKYEISSGLSVQSGVSIIGTSGNPADTVIKRIVTGDNDRVAYLRTPANATIPTRLQNLTFTGGYTIYQGGGVGAVDGCNYIASNCVVSCSKASYGGGGAMGGTWYDSTFRECEIFKYAGGNAALGGRTYASLFEMSGGGAYGGTFYRCRFENNKSVYAGGGLGGGGVGPAYLQAKNNLGTTVSLNRPDLVARAYGCTFVGNESGHGAGAFSFDRQSLFLSDCTFISNKTVTTEICTSSTALCGGGVYFGTVTNCTFEANEAAYGGGLYGGFASGCTFTNNAATFRGGAVSGSGYVTAWDPATSNRAVLVDCTLVGNRADYAAGGAYCTLATNTTIAANRLTATNGDSANGGAGGTYCDLVECRVLDNNSGNVSFGGGLLRSNATRCLVAGNRAKYGGAGCFACVFRESILSNNTAVGYQGTACYNCTTYKCIVVDNKFEGSSNGRGVLCRGYHEGDLVYHNGYLTGGVLAAELNNNDVVAVNCTIVDNTGNDSHGNQFGAASGAYTNCVFAGNGIDMHSGVPIAVNCVWQWDNATSPATMVECQAKVDPKFAGAQGKFSPYEIRSSSPCRDRGLLLDWMTDDAKDLKGDPRVRFGVVDVGAFECFNIPGVSIVVR